jgi:predicted dehydrogenase
MHTVKKGSKVRYAVVGAGHIAQVAVLPAFAHARDNSELVALVSGNPTKRDELREKYELELIGDYSELESVIERGTDRRRVHRDAERVAP